MKRIITLFTAQILVCACLKAQNNVPYSLQQLIDSALTNNHQLSIKSLQVQERMSRLKEDGVKRYPSATLSASTQYVFTLGELSIPAGALGTVATNTGSAQPLPGESTQLRLGQHQNYNIDLSVYQPILEQSKIGTALEIDKVEIRLSEKERARAASQLTLAVQKIYYAILIARKQLEQATAQLDLARARLLDIETALAAGKTVGSDILGLQANVAEEEHNVLRQSIVLQDYTSELKNITGITRGDVSIQPMDTTTIAIGSIDFYRERIAANPDVQIAKINKEKALLGIKAARQANLPDIGLTAGYYYQKGNPILPTTSPHIGISFRWNIQDLFSNYHSQRQREYQFKQSEQYVAYQQQLYTTDLDKAYRKLDQLKALMDVARKTVSYRNAELKVQQDRQSSGFNVTTSLLDAKSSLSKAEADFYAAQLSYLYAAAELKNLAGQ